MGIGGAGSGTGIRTGPRREFVTSTREARAARAAPLFTDSRAASTPARRLAAAPRNVDGRPRVEEGDVARRAGTVVEHLAHQRRARFRTVDP